MAKTANRIIIDPDDLIVKLNQLETQCDGDLARMIEMLLLENHMLARQQSRGLLRGLQFEFSQFPRFLKLTDQG